MLVSLKNWMKFEIAYKIPWFLRTLLVTPAFLLKYRCYPNKKNIFTHIRFHLGDNLTHIHYLQELAIRYPETDFHHFCQMSYIKDMSFYVQKQKNIHLYDLKECPVFSCDAWKNRNRFWETYPDKLLFVQFFVQFFQRFSQKLKVENPIEKPEDFIFDGEIFKEASGALPQYDWFVVNSIPLSNQIAFDVSELDALCLKISKKHSVITTRKVGDLPCTMDGGMSLCDLASQSLNCQYHLMISTGPSWFVLNSINLEKSKGVYLFLEKEEVKFCESMQQFRTIDEFDKFYMEHFSA